ncbi:MAG: hypothetical protein HY996_07750 [Micrococcales bacterium]|nr:hypothetical protein [Micrococcales bacterium]
MADEGRGRLGQWSTAEGNYWEATVREELVLGLTGADADDTLTTAQLDEIAGAMALGLKYLWDTSSRYPVPRGFEPAWPPPESPAPIGALCPSCGGAMARIDETLHGEWACSACGVVRLA